MIFILTGAIRSGKTTTLLSWIKNRNDIDGLLCPDAENGKRCFLKIKSQLKIALETDIELKNEAVIEVGKFRFLESGFKKANNFLLSLSFETDNSYIIIDELGKLELNNEGLHLASETLISKFIFDKKQHLILVVRDYLVDDILKHYGLSEYMILTKDNLNELLV